MMNGMNGWMVSGGMWIWMVVCALVVVLLVVAISKLAKR